MSARVLTDSIEGKACLYDSVTLTAFGPVFEGVERHATLDDPGEEAAAFLGWLMDPGTDAEDAGASPYADPRQLNVGRLEEIYAEWRARRQAEAS